MDTTYYSFETKKIKVSGGADMLALVPTPVPAPASPAGEVLDFALCRRRLETKEAWKGLAQAVESVKTPEGFDEDAVYEAVAAAPAKKARKTPRAERAGGWLELCASVAVILVCVWVGWGFLALV